MTISNLFEFNDWINNNEIGPISLNTNNLKFICRVDDPWQYVAVHRTIFGFGPSMLSRKTVNSTTIRKSTIKFALSS
jgi:hypothetical protein